MLLPRIIPCLLIKNGGLVKTINFDNPKYVGDPINAVKIFNEKEVDELIVLDIDATAQSRKPDYSMIKNLAAECRMPLCYGGGIKKVDQIEEIISLGVEKVAISSAAIYDSQVIEKAAKLVGSQSIVVVMDVKQNQRSNYEIWIYNASKPTGLDVLEIAKKVEDLGAGEVVINSIDRDGVMKGYDLDLISKIRGAINLPITVLGGAGTLKDIETLVHSFGTIGAAAGSLFVFKGRYRAVLINYPNRTAKDALMQTDSKAYIDSESLSSEIENSQEKVIGRDSNEANVIRQRIEGLQDPHLIEAQNLPIFKKISNRLRLFSSFFCM